METANMANIRLPSHLASLTHEERTRLAVDKIEQTNQDGRRLSFRRAARMYGISKSTVHRHMQKRKGKLPSRRRHDRRSENSSAGNQQARSFNGRSASHPGSSVTQGPSASLAYESPPPRVPNAVISPTSNICHPSDSHKLEPIGGSGPQQIVPTSLNSPVPMTLPGNRQSLGSPSLPHPPHGLYPVPTRFSQTSGLHIQEAQHPTVIRPPAPIEDNRNLQPTIPAVQYTTYPGQSYSGWHHAQHHRQSYHMSPQNMRPLSPHPMQYPEQGHLNQQQVNQSPLLPQQLPRMSTIMKSEYNDPRAKK